MTHKTISNTPTLDAVVIGAGASGLMCAMTAGKRGKKVLVLDHANKAGKKILMSGGGRCNFTNYEVEPKHYLSQNPHFCKSALSKYLNWDFIGMIIENAIPYHEREHGQLFCDNSANDVLQMLLTECEKNNVKIQLKTQIETIETAENGFVLTVKQTEKVSQVYCQSLVIATGGLSIPTMGATGFGYQIAEQFGHSIVPTSAGLVPFTLTDSVGEAFKALSGISLEVVMFNERISFQLPLLFTHRGLSGPASLQVSNYWQVGEPIFINFFPKHDIAEFLLTQKKSHPKSLIRTVLSEFLPKSDDSEPLPKKLLLTLQSLVFDKVKDIELANIKDDDLAHIGKTLNAFKITPSGTEGYRTAEVTRGGVATDNISSKTLESQLQPNLYFCGEVLDVTGWLGGYNFQWAWASGFVVGQNV